VPRETRGGAGYGFSGILMECPIAANAAEKPALIKKEIKFSSYIRKFRVEQQLQSHI
jgi:hypothetical protein